MVTFRVKRCFIVINNPLIMATKYKFSQKVISLLETCFLFPDNEMVSKFIYINDSNSINCVSIWSYFLLFAVSFLPIPNAVEAKKDAAAIRARGFYCFYKSIFYIQFLFFQQYFPFYPSFHQGN